MNTGSEIIVDFQSAVSNPTVTGAILAISKEEAEQSIDDIKNWNDTKHYHRVTKGGRVYITTKDFFKQPRVKDQLKKLKESGIIEEIEKNNGRNRT